MTLLAADEPAAVTTEREHGTSPYVVVCDHAGREIPRKLGDLGLSEADRERHIAWDIGALGVARELSRLLDAPLVWQRYSRLVVDCNRPHDNPDLIPCRSEATTIPGNLDLSAAARGQRIAEIHTPYHSAISALLDARLAAARRCIVIAVHSFTPVYHGVPRPWEIGLLYGPDRRLHDLVRPLLTASEPLCVGDNEPYAIDGKDHTIPAHALDRRLSNLLFEIRQDLIAAPAHQIDWGGRLGAVLRQALPAAAELADRV